MLTDGSFFLFGGFTGFARASNMTTCGDDTLLTIGFGDIGGGEGVGGT